MKKMNSPKNPVISIIMPVFNQAQYVKAAIDSIINQSFKNWELIIIDDASTDATVECVKLFTDIRIILFRNKINLGISSSVNKGLSIARGTYIARMDADDISLPNRLDTQINYLKKYPNIGLVGSWAKLISSDGKVFGIKKFPELDKQLKKMFHYMNPIIHPTVMFRKDLISLTGLYNQGLEGAEDYDLWLRFAKVTKLANIPMSLIKYRLHADNVSFSSTNRVRLAYAKVQIRKFTMYGYPFWEVIFGLKSLVAMLLPSRLSRFIYQHFYGYSK